MSQHTKKKLDTLSCIVCDKKLSAVMPPATLEAAGYSNHPDNGLIFVASGQYGTTVFDPMDGSSLEINICDGCIVKAAKKKQVLHNEPPNRHLQRKHKINYWDGKVDG